MAKRTYIGVDNKSRKIKSLYVGVNGKARSVKAVYIGVNGIARLCWKKPGIYKYSGNITGLDKAKSDMASCKIRKYALFSGGECLNDNNFYYYSSVIAYDSSLTRQMASDLRSSKSGHAGSSIDTCGLFAGGYTGSKYLSSVDRYDGSLTRSIVTALSYERSGLAGAHAGSSYIFFAGGYNSDTSFIDKRNKSIVDAYEYPTMTKSTVSNLSEGRHDLSGASIGDYALFAGGGVTVLTNFVSGPTQSKAVDAYDSSGTKISCDSLSSESGKICSTSIGDYALFACYGKIDVYSTSLTRTNTIALNKNVYPSDGTTVEDYAIFAGGSNTYWAANSSSTIIYVNDVFVFNKYLTKIDNVGKLNKAKSGVCAESIGNYALFVGGYIRNSSNDNSTDISDVEAYESI